MNPTPDVAPHRGVPEPTARPPAPAADAMRSHADLPPGLDEVALVAWPDDAVRRAELAAAGRPRILLIGPAASPPQTWDDDEDWIREPVDPTDLGARAAALLSKRARQRGPGRRPLAVLGADGLLREGDRWVALPPVEARLLARLIHRSGEVVPRADLVAAGWPQGAPDGRVLDDRIKHLRKRIKPFGLEIHTVRGHGYLLPPPDAAPS